MKHFYLKSLSCAIVAGTMTTTAVYAADNANVGKNVKVAVEENYGDYMSGGSDLSTKTVYLYDSNNRLLRKMNIDAANNELMQYFSYEYNALGQLICNFSQSYMEIESGRWGLADPTEKTVYEYDDKGRLIAETGNQSYKYEYDNDNNLVKKTLLMQGFDNELTVMQTITYSDFVAPNCPQKTVSVGAEGFASYDYQGELEYDKNFNLLKETNYTVSGENKTFLNSTRYVYDESGMMTTKVRHSSSSIYDENWNEIGKKEVPVDSVVYTRLDENRVKEQSYTYNDYDEETPWNISPTFKITVSREFDGTLAAKLNVETVEGEKNTNKVTVIPANTAAEGYEYDIYRDGQKIATLDPKTALTYTDSKLYNGKHEYFAQTVKTGDAAVEYNISDIAAVENKIDFPAPTNLRGVSKEVTSDNSSMNIAWDAPKYTADMEFQGYNIIEAGEYGDNKVNYEGTISDTKYSVDMYNYYTERNLYIQAVYKLGTANSETKLIKMDDLGEASAINTVKSVAGNVNYADGIITTAERAKITLHDMSGKKVAATENSTSLSIADQPCGVYLVSVERDGKVSVLKVRK